MDKLQYEIIEGFSGEIFLVCQRSVWNVLCLVKQGLFYPHHHQQQTKYDQVATTYIYRGYCLKKMQMSAK